MKLRKIRKVLQKWSATQTNPLVHMKYSLWNKHGKKKKVAKLTWRERLEFEHAFLIILGNVKGAFKKACEDVLGECSSCGSYVHPNLTCQEEEDRINKLYLEDVRSA